MFSWSLVLIHEFILKYYFFVLVWLPFIGEEAFIWEERLLKIHKLREASVPVEAFIRTGTLIRKNIESYLSYSFFFILVQYVGVGPTRDAMIKRF